ncbi:MAG: DNA gyrase subunit A [Acidimicrobiia bacterium]|nr:DNA gyrase subunit A [Acidimicrobiia bacterium]MBP8179387.1 DNA gyrase subunit A [Acidimicrobiia bacterium]
MAPDDVTVEPAENPQIEIQEEMERSFLDYAMSVIVSRALPDVRDGLKPVHRRILYGMYAQGIRPDRPHRKCARVVGDVMGRYHPHGDSAIYDALARMAQNFSLRHILIDGHGNFGSPDPNDRPAAMRYTECRLSPLAMQMLTGIDEDTIDFIDTYDGEDTEPEVLPARFPNLLVNGSTGIAVGMATNIPPHNMGEVIDAAIHMLDNPTADADALMEFVKGPDFPTGAYILGRRGIQDAYRTGRGSVKMRAKAEVQEGKNGRTEIIVTEVPFQTSVEVIGTKIEELTKERRIDGISDVTNSSARGNQRLVVTLRRDANAQVILNQLYKLTPMQTSFGVNMLALDHGVPKLMTLPQVLKLYCDHQVEVVTRRTQFRLRKAQDRAHIVEGLLRAIDMLDEVISLIRGSADVETARFGLMAEPFAFSEIQANHILDMPLRRLTGLERQKLQDEYRDLLALITELESILADEDKLKSVIKTELTEIRDKFADERRSIITHDPGELDDLDLIDDEELVVTVSNDGYIKAMSPGVFREQGRGGKGIAGARLKDGDYVAHLLTTTAHAYLLFFSNRGRVYRIRGHEIPLMDRTARGLALVNLLQLDQGEQVQAIIDTRTYEEGAYLLFATRQGLIKKTRMSAYDSSLRAGLIAINLKDGDELVRVLQTNGANEILIVSANGKAIRFDESDVRPMGRAAAGVRGMRLSGDDAVVDCDVLRPGTEVLTVTSGGLGKRTPMDQFRIQGRGGQGIRAMSLRPDDRVVASFVVDETDQMMLVSSSGNLIRFPVADVSVQGRSARGVMVARVKEHESIVAAARVLDTIENLNDDEASSDSETPDSIGPSGPGTSETAEPGHEEQQ